MNTPSLLIAAMVLLPAVAAGAWAWWAMARTENELRIEAGLEKADFDIGTWSSGAPLAR